jgi:hypothetical protein
MGKRLTWWNTLPGQVILSFVFIGVALVLAPRIVDRLPIPTDSVAWAILPWILIVLIWVVMVRQLRTRGRQHRANG